MPPFDLDMQRKRFAKMRDLLPELLGLYRENAPEQLDRMRAALAGGDLDGAALAAHTLKGMSAVICAEAVRARCLDLETAARAGDARASALALEHLEQAARLALDHLEAVRAAQGEEP